MKPIFISRHALLRVRQREISLEEVKATIRRPDLKVPSKRGRLKAVKKFRGRELVVIYKRTRHLDIVVTVFWRENVDFIR